MGPEEIRDWQGRTSLMEPPKILLSVVSQFCRLQYLIAFPCCADASPAVQASAASACRTFAAIAQPGLHSSLSSLALQLLQHIMSLSRADATHQPQLPPRATSLHPHDVQHNGLKDQVTDSEEDSEDAAAAELGKLALSEATESLNVSLSVLLLGLLCSKEIAKIAMCHVLTCVSALIC